MKANHSSLIALDFRLHAGLLLDDMILVCDHDRFLYCVLCSLETLP